MVRGCMVLAVVLAASSAFGATYEVGPGKPIANVGDVPWESLNAGDTVLIYARPTPYREKWVISRAGTALAPITVRGVADGSGNLPVISGDNATTRLQLNYTNESRGVIKIGTASPDVLPQHIVIEDLDIRSARPGYTFTDDAGNTGQSYISNAAAIYVERGQHIVIRGCELHDTGNGLFVGIYNGDTQDITVEGNYIHDNGNVGSVFEHNSYTAAVGIVFQYNRYGPLCAGCGGNGLKDRSIGTVVRYNWIESGNRQLDLVDAEDDPSLITDPRYRATFVYGNVLIEPDGAGNSQICHYGGDSGDTSIYRKGVLHFFNNTVVSTRSGNTTLLRLSTNEETADVRNNVVFVSAAGNRLAMLDGAGTLELRNNWFKTGFVDSHSGLTGTITIVSPNVLGTSPGFVDQAGQNFRLVAASACRGAATSVNPAVVPAHDVVRHYVEHRQSEARPSDGALDIGAFEFSAAVPGSTPTRSPTPFAGATPTASATTVGGTPTSGGPTATPTPVVTSTPRPTPTSEVCFNCIDDDGDGDTDRADDSCPPLADGAGQGATGGAGKAILKCAVALQKAGATFAAKRLARLQTCVAAVARCVQQAPGDTTCLGAATSICAKRLAGFTVDEDRLAQAIAKACGALPAGDLRSASGGLGFAAEDAPCVAGGASAPTTVAELAACVQRGHACRVEELLTFETPRAAELLALAGRTPADELPCLDAAASGGGAGIDDPTRAQALGKCGQAIRKAGRKFVVGERKALQKCAGALNLCLFKTGAAEPPCLTEGRAICARAIGALTAPGNGVEPRLAAAVSKACGLPALPLADMLSDTGLGYGALAPTCAGLDVPALDSLDALVTCVTRQHACRVEQLLEREAPRLRELLGLGGVTP